LERTPTAFPTIEFGEGISTIDDFTAEKIILKNYNPQKPIKMEMALSGGAVDVSVIVRSSAVGSGNPVFLELTFGKLILSGFTSSKGTH
ncbi:hypothetical protein OSTOST_12063, partial [Ostertagia ostertagi]